MGSASSPVGPGTIICCPSHPDDPLTCRHWSGPEHAPWPASVLCTMQKPAIFSTGLWAPRRYGGLICRARPPVSHARPGPRGLEHRQPATQGWGEAVTADRCTGGGQGAGTCVTQLVETWTGQTEVSASLASGLCPKDPGLCLWLSLAQGG